MTAFNQNDFEMFQWLARYCRIPIDEELLTEPRAPPALFHGGDARRPNLYLSACEHGLLSFVKWLHTLPGLNYKQRVVRACCIMLITVSVQMSVFVPVSDRLRVTCVYVRIV